MLFNLIDDKRSERGEACAIRLQCMHFRMDKANSQLLLPSCKIPPSQLVRSRSPYILLSFSSIPSQYACGICSFLVVQVPQDTSLIRDRSICSFIYSPCTLLNTNNFIFRLLVLDSLMTRRSEVKRVLMDRSEVSLL